MKIIFRLRESGQTEVNTEAVMKNVPKLIYFTQIYACECPLINIFFFPIYMIGLGGGALSSNSTYESGWKVVCRWSSSGQI